MNKKDTFRSSGPSFSTGIGSSSILVIFVILCLVSFATLSIVSANADFKLSTKVLDRTTTYYEASNQVESLLAQLDQTLLSAYEASSSEEEYFESAGHSQSFLIPLSDLQSLEVTVSIEYPKKEGDTFYQIQSWQVITTEELDYEGTLNLIKW